MDLGCALLKKRTIKSLSLIIFVAGLIFVISQLKMARRMDESDNDENDILNGIHNRDVISLRRSRIVSEPDVFLCNDGLSIARNKLNDDYCDCADGSDEPETAACSGISYFECHNRFKKVRIPSSRVNDSICDCCDGSDEFNNKKSFIDLNVEEQRKIGQFVVPCPNTCP